MGFVLMQQSDWAQGVVFEDGKPAYLHATIHSSGKCQFSNAEASRHADAFAEWYESGVRWLVHTSPNGGQAVPYGKYGEPIRIFNDTNISMRSSGLWLRKIMPRLQWAHNDEKSINEQLAMEGASVWGSF